MKKALTALLLAVAFVVIAMPAQAATSRSLGRTLTQSERQTYRCGAYRGHLPVRAFIVHRKGYVLLPKHQLGGKRFTYRCGSVSPRPVNRPAPAPAPVPAVPVAGPVPAPAPVPAPVSTCRTEIGDPTTVPHVAGFTPTHDVDFYDPSPYGGDDIDPMTRWNDTATGLAVDTAGHVTVTRDGVVYNHPVGSEQFGLAALHWYRTTGQRVWLDRAITAMRDVIATATPEGQIPQDYPWTGPEGHALARPAYSGLAQGQAISLAARLATVTGDPLWRTQADRFFTTLATPGTASPSITFVDTAGYLWFEEFPLECPSRVWNGHVFATFAMADYYHLTGSPEALRLFDAGATTALAYMPAIRNPGDLANYGASHVHPVNTHYHRFMTEQLRDLAAMTGSPAFADWADLLYADYH